ncbi:uncharacterized protein P884DRAFT_195913 [Thermothelomyces heterothallicus CBS 202.75]|uniref:uncharacterized protein n=1 Tax=Thermothelomyces heterothallicus CBS 202.75 TaxID=1149848 RepID=UPI003744280E
MRLFPLLLPLASAEALVSWTISSLACRKSSAATYTPRTYTLALDISPPDRDAPPICTLTITSFLDDGEGASLTLVPAVTARDLCAFFGYTDVGRVGSSGAAAESRSEAGFTGGSLPGSSPPDDGGDNENEDRRMQVKSGAGLVTDEKRGFINTEVEERKEWQVKGLTRCNEGSQTPCSPKVPTSDPVGSFYGIPCGSDDDPGFKASWGYNGDTDSAVMTICYVPNGTDAWFGFEQVSKNQWLGDSKKEPVYFTGCA